MIAALQLYAILNRCLFHFFNTRSLKIILLIAVEADNNTTQHPLHPCMTMHGGARRRPVCMVPKAVPATARHRPTTQSRPLCRIGYPTHRRPTGTLATCTDPLPTGTYPFFSLTLSYLCLSHCFAFSTLNFPSIDSH